MDSLFSRVVIAFLHAQFIFGVVFAFLRAKYIFCNCNCIPPCTVYLLESYSHFSAHSLSFRVVMVFLRTQFIFWSCIRIPPRIIFSSRNGIPPRTAYFLESHSRSCTHSLSSGVVIAFLRAQFIFWSHIHVAPRIVYLLDF